MLILAGITLNLVMNGGVVQKMQLSAQAHINEAAREEIQLKIAEVRMECLREGKEFTVAVLAENIKNSNEITILRYYNEPTASIKEGVVENLNNLKGIAVSVDRYKECIFLIGLDCNIKGMCVSDEAPLLMNEFYSNKEVGDIEKQEEIAEICTITLDKVEGTGGLSTVYEAYNTGYYTDSELTTQMTTTANAITIPTKTGYAFQGYYTAATGGTKIIDSTGKITSQATAREFSANGTLYAQWVEGIPVYYAVQIYGINQDEDASGNAIGLTFGPATGANYNNAYVTHEYEETSTGSGTYNVKIITHTVAEDGSETTASEYLKNSSNNNVTRTAAQVAARENINLHEMTWTQIAAVSDKNVFIDCMLCGDTKRVELVLNSTIASGTTQIAYGDGPGTLYYTINSYYLKWNPNKNNDNSYVGTGVTLDDNEKSLGSNARNAGGYSSSHIRATLIGKNTKTNEGYAGNVNLTSETSLYSCISSELQGVITPKKVKYVTGTSKDSNNLNTDITDAIWLFSEREICGTGEYSGGAKEGLGSSGIGYDKFRNIESKYYISQYSRSSNSNRSLYREFGAVGSLWLRSPSLDRTYFSCNGDSDILNRAGAAGTYGLGFGFCIE